MTKESTLETYDPFDFDPLYNVNDRRLLGSITLEGAEDPRLENPRWLDSMRHYIKNGSQDVRNAGILQINAAYAARKEFAQEIRVYDPDHPLHNVYKNHKSIPLPKNILDVVATLDEMTGDGVAALHMSGGSLGWVTAAHLQRRFNYMERLANVLGWQGDVRQVLATCPYLLRNNPVALLTLAHLAAKHGANEDTRLDVPRVCKLLRSPTEAHMLAAVSDDSYQFGQYTSVKKIGVKTASEQVHDALADSSIAERLGHAVTHTYRRYRPDKEALEGKANPDYVTGHEPWLRRLRSKRKLEAGSLASELNALISKGGSLSGYTEESSAYTAIVDARANLFEALGLIDQKDATYPDFLRFLDQNHAFVSTRTIITVCRQLAAHDIPDPLHVIRHCFRILVKPGFIEPGLTAIEEYGIAPKVALQYHPGLLARSPEAIKQVLDINRTLVKINAGKKVASMASRLPKTPEDTRPSGVAFDPCRYKQDMIALYLVTLDSSKLDDPAWVERIKEYVAAVPPRPGGLRGAKGVQVRSIQHQFARETGLDNPEHPLAVAYSRGGDTGMVPNMLLQTIQMLQRLTGNALLTVMNNQKLLLQDSRTLAKRFRYIERMGAVLGWKGNARKLVTDYPTTLTFGDRRSIFLAHLAAEHATPADAGMSHARLASIINADPEDHLLELLRNPEYRFGDHVPRDERNRIGIKRARQHIYQAMRDPAEAKKIGDRSIQVYLRFHPYPTETQK